MAKAPIPGYCKTRLIPHIGALSAARVQGHLLQKTIETALASGLGPVTIWCAPDTRHTAFTQARSTQGVRLNKQLGDDLGQRMLYAIRQGLRKHEKVIVLGTDCPALREDDLLYAVAQLNKVDHVFQPASDGGYVMVATRQYQPHLFRHVPWGGPKVLSVTQRRLQQLNRPFQIAPTLWDVDDIADLRRAMKAGLIA